MRVGYLTRVVRRLMLRPLISKAFIAVVIGGVSFGSLAQSADAIEIGALDILGLRTGQTAEEAEAVLRRTYPDATVTRTTKWAASREGEERRESATYCALRQRTAPGIDCGDAVTLFFANSSGRVVGVRRIWSMGMLDKGVPTKEVVEELNAKYGTPPRSDLPGLNKTGSHTFAWRVAPPKQSAAVDFLAFAAGKSLQDECIRMTAATALGHDLPSKADAKCGLVINASLLPTSPGVTGSLTTVMLDLTAIAKDYVWSAAYAKALDAERVERLKRKATGELPKL